MRIQTGKFALASDLCQTSYQQLAKQNTSLYSLSTYSFNDYQVALLPILQKKQERLLCDLKALQEYFQTSIAVYNKCEQTIQQQLPASSITQEKNAPSWQFHTTTMETTHRFHTSFSSTKSIMDYVRNGICAGVFAGFTLASATVDKRTAYVQCGAGISVGKAVISGDARIQFMEDKACKPSLVLTASASVALAEAQAHARVGNAYIAVEGEASGSVGVAQAEAKAVINKDEITFKANVGVAALKGDVKGTFSIFGIKITLSGSGEVGSIGCGAEFSSKKGEFSFGGKASLIAGLGFKIKVDYGG